jgi:hypothetical protein
VRNSNDNSARALWLGPSVNSNGKPVEQCMEEWRLTQLGGRFHEEELTLPTWFRNKSAPGAWNPVFQALRELVWHFAYWDAHWMTV